MNKKELVEQTRNAFDFLQKLYLESSYLVKEIEGLLGEEIERFIIGRIGGYAVAARSSVGLEPQNVNFWLMRKFSAFFIPQDETNSARGITSTALDSGKKLIYVRIFLDDKEHEEPTIYFGILRNFRKMNQPGKWPEKVEHIISHLENQDDRFWLGYESGRFEDSYIRFEIRLERESLYEIDSSDTLRRKVVDPVLALYRSS